jgi:hypothetical protein
MGDSGAARLFARHWPRVYPVVLIVAVIGLVVQALAVAFVLLVLNSIANQQHLEVGGVSPSTAKVGLGVLGAALVLFLICCGALLVRSLRRLSGGLAQGLLMACAALEMILTIVSAPLFGWTVFAVVVLTMAALVTALAWLPLADARAVPPAANAPAPAGPASWDADTRPIASAVPDTASARGEPVESPEVGDGHVDPGEQAP